MTIVTTRIKELRARYNLTQDDLADMVGVTRQTMLYLEKGKYNPSLVLAYKVAKALNATIEEVFIIEENSFGDGAVQATLIPRLLPSREKALTFKSFVRQRFCWRGRYRPGR